MLYNQFEMETIDHVLIQVIVIVFETLSVDSSEFIISVNEKLFGSLSNTVTELYIILHVNIWLSWFDRFLKTPDKFFIQSHGDNSTRIVHELFKVQV